MISTGAVIVWCLVAAEGILFVLIHAIGFLITSSSPRRTSENEDDAWKLEWRNVSYGIRQFRQPPKLLLKDVSGSAAPGEILAVMGASGSGKTTLLDVLSGNIGRGGRKGLFSGNIFVNGARINSSLLMNKQCCFVFQKETLLSCFTVDEYLKFIAGMLGYDSVTQARRLDEVRKLLRIEHIGSHRIGDDMESQISGGQRRKVALAEGLLSNNRLLFLDEPTTGLSASDAQELMDVLRDVADHGFTIIMTIHQPRQSIFAKINNVLLISAGNQVYFGPTAGVTDYFEAHGFTLPEDEIVSDGALDVLENAKCATELSTMWRTENPPAPLDYTEDNRRVLLTFLVQSLRNFATVGALPREFLCLAKMYILVALRHLPAIVLMAVVDVLNGVLIGLIFLNLGDDMSHFFNYVAAIFCIIRRAPTFPAISALYYQLKPNVELQIFVGRYKTFTFAISWILRVTIHQIISAALLAIVPTVMLGFNVETVFATWAVCTMILMVMSMLISSFSVIMPQFPISMSLSVMVFLLAMIANGFFIREQDVWEGLRWTVPVGFVRQFLDISTHLELADMDFTDEVTKLRTSGSELLKNQGFRGQLLYDFGLGLVWVMATILLYTLLTYGKNIYCRMVISRRLSISNIKKNEELFQTLDTPEHPEQPHIEDDPFLRTEDIDANAMFAWHNVTVQTQTGDELLHGVSGFLKAGEVLAIMGPSGSGKSTLVNCLSGVATSGLVTRETLIVNKQVIAANSIQHYVSFMTQNEVLSPFLTVQEILTMTADLRLRNLSFKDRAVRVNHVMQLTKLGRVQFSRLDKLSGGERKRVSLAQTLLCTKQILVLDEPTSGLSGSDAKLIVNIIREYAKTYNAIVLVTIHQPRSSVFFRFDKLLLLCQGCPCYFGSPANAKNFFALNGIPIDRHIPNEADAILDMILDAAYAGMDNEDVFYRVEALHDLHTSKQQRSMENAFREYLDQPPVTIRNWNIKGILNEIIVLTEWYGKVQLRNRSTGLGFFIRSTILAVLFGLFFLSLSHSAEAVFSRVGSIYLIGVIGYAFFVLPQGYAELHNLPFMLHDTRVGLYRLPIAAVVNWGITHCRIAVASVIMSVVTFWMIGYDGVFRKFMIYLLGIHLLGLWGYLTSLMCCMISWSAPLAVLMGSNLMIVLTSFTGFLVTLDNIPGFLHWLIYINPVYYVNELLVVNEMIAQSFDCDHPDQIHLLVSCPVTGLQVIEYFGYDVHSVLKDVLCCIALLAGYFMLAFAGLMIRENWRPPAFIVRTVSRLRRKNVEESRFRFGEGNRNLVKFV